jgi:hypothetical protein
MSYVTASEAPTEEGRSEAVSSHMTDCFALLAMTDCFDGVPLVHRDRPPHNDSGAVTANEVKQSPAAR